MDSRQTRKAHAAIRKAIKVAERRGVPAIPIMDARDYLEGMFDDPFERLEVIAAYDHSDDVIVFNPDHPVWADMTRFLRENPGLYGTQHPLHIVRHELGHAAHYRSLDERDRQAVWDADLSSPERDVARKVSYRAAWNVKEFVAEVYACLWARVTFDQDVISIHDLYRGPRP
jgi:hypothetical protein